MQVYGRSSMIKQSALIYCFSIYISVILHYDIPFFIYTSQHILLLSVNIASKSHDESSYYFKRTDEEACQKSDRKQEWEPDLLTL